MLNKLGHEVVIAENGKVAVDAAKKQKFDLILMDIQMPIMNGKQALVNIRADSLNKDIPVVVLSAFASYDNLDEYKDIGFEACLSKPIDKSELVNTLSNLLKSSTKC